MLQAVLLSGRNFFRQGEYFRFIPVNKLPDDSLIHNGKKETTFLIGLYL
jgi:hypothetical protein